ncbi:hypothetical protein FQZ97_953440 [compost metagenome]
MGNGHTVPQAGGAQAFASEEAVGDQRTVEAMQGFKQQARFFKGTFFAGRVHAHEHLRSGQYGR